jgi:sialidase-1
MNNGRSWSDALSLTADGVGGDLGYPSTVECDDGTLVTVWYEVLAESPKAQLRQAKWKLKS